VTNLRLGLLAGLVLGSMCAPAPSSAEVLYDQTTNAAVPNADPNQLNFAPSNLFGSTEELTVDDFEFPRGDTWVIDQVDVTGAFHGNPPAQVNVYILGEDLSNSEGVPIAFSQKGIAAAGGPNYVIPLKGARLLGGTYWLGVQQAGATSGGYWSWGTSTVRTGGSARHGTPFVNTPNCPVGVFNVRLDCYDGNSPDQVFRISGTDLTLKLGKPKLDKDEGTAELPVTVHGPGELNLHANAIATQEEEVTQTGTTEMLVKARGKARRKLNRSGSVRVNAAVTFTAAGGRSVTEDRVVKLAKRVG
jgi:hypothetical protein